MVERSATASADSGAISERVAGGFLADLLESRRPCRDVVSSVKEGGSDFSHSSTVMFALGAMVAHGLATDRTRKLVCRCSAAALLFALLFTTGYSLWKIIPGYTHHRDALVTFCRKIRKEAVAHQLHYEVVSSGNKDRTEGMLLYLEKLHFVTLNEAVEKWNNNQIQELVIPSDKMEAAMVALPQAQVTRTVKPKDTHLPSYVLVTRSPAA